jgi:hypothetical protein
MVTNVTRTPDPRYRTVGGIHLADRFQHAVDRAARQIPEGAPERDGIFGLMVSEHNIDLLYNAVEKFKQRAALPVPPELRAEWNALCDLQRHHNEVVREIVELQKTFLWRCNRDWRHRLLRSAKADMFVAPAIIDTDWDTKECPDIKTTRIAQQKARAQLERALELRALIGNAVAFDGEPPEAQAIHMVHALFDNANELSERVIKLEALVSALQAELNRKPKRAA